MADYSIWVLEYATQPKTETGGIIYGAYDQGFRAMPYAYVVLQSKDHVAMVDVGHNHADFGETLAVSYGVALLQWRELQDGVESNLAFPSRAGAAVVESVKRIGSLLERLECRFALNLTDDAELPVLLIELGAIRGVLQAASCPQHGLAIVDFTGACCAGAH